MLEALGSNPAESEILNQTTNEDEERSKPDESLRKWAGVNRKTGQEGIAQEANAFGKAEG